MIDCYCGFGKDIPEEQKTCPVCGTDVSPLHRLQALPNRYYEQGVHLKERGELDGAIQALSTAVSLNHESADFFLALGDAYAKKEMFNQAISQYSHGLAIRPDDDRLREALKQTEAAQVEHSSVAGSKAARPGFPVKLVTVLSLIAFCLGLGTTPLFQALNKPRQSAPPDRETLAANLKQTLATDPLFKDLRLQAAATDGGVRVTGDVPTELHKRLVAEIAKNTLDAGSQAVIDLRVNALKAEPVLYTIQRGDSLSFIAKQFYRDRSLWGKIYAANRDRLSAPDRLSVGQVIVVPK